MALAFKFLIEFDRTWYKERKDNASTDKYSGIFRARKE